MAASLFDSALFGRLVAPGETGRLFTDAAEIRAMLLVEGALAEAQGARGIIPEAAAQAIRRAAMELPLDPGALAAETARNGVPVPALVAAFRREMNAPEYAQFVHWGATSQDIQDTGLMLRLRQALTHVEASARDTLARLGALAETHAEQPMAARTYGQFATVTSFGAMVATWGAPVLDLLGELDALRRDCLLVSLSGAAGTASELGPDPEGLRADLAAALGLADPKRPWHTDRAPLLRIADWLVRLSLALAKMGEDVTELAQGGIGELRLTGAGASSTMPQKQNPVGPAMIAALARQGAALLSALHGAAMPRHQRDGAAWFTEWLVLPQIVLGAAAAAERAREVAGALAPDAGAMARALAADGGLIQAEALSFALAAAMPRPEAQAAVKALCVEARESGAALSALVARDHPEIDAGALFDPARRMGTAPADARRFAAMVRGS